MKTYLILAILLIASTFLAAQVLSPWQGVRHSSVDPDGNMHMKFNVIPDEVTTYEFHYSINGANWLLGNTVDIGAGEMQTLVPYQFGQNLRYRLRAESFYMEESFAYLNPAYLESESFPPALGQYALINTDASGDSIMIYHPTLDVTDSYFAATENKLFTAIANVSETFPTMNSVTSYNIYLCTLMNPESAMGDSVMYAMVFSFNIPGVLSPGLYKIGMDENQSPVFDRLGNIQSQVTGGKLHMACNISDLTSDPGFGAWPNAYNALAVSMLTMRINVDLATFTPEFLLGDYSNPGVLDFTDYRYQVNQNSLPELYNFFVSPENFFLRVAVMYQDEDGDFPLIAELELDNGDVYPMHTSAMDFSEPASYDTMVPETVVWETAVLRFSDNITDLVNLEIYCTALENNTNIPMALACKMPNPISSGSKVYNINLSGLDKSPIQIDLYNLKGQKLGNIHSSSNNNSESVIPWNGTINSQRLSSGIYFMKVRQGTRFLNKKLIVIR